MRRVQRGTLVWIAAGVACLVVLGVIYQHQRHPQTPDSEAVTTVKSELARRGLEVDQVNCDPSRLDPKKLPAVTQVAKLHPDQLPLLYDCSAELKGTPPKNEPGFDLSWCVLGFTGSAPWVAYATQYRCASMVRKA
jgi:hypothetical protein